MIVAPGLAIESYPGGLEKWWDGCMFCRRGWDYGPCSFYLNGVRFLSLAFELKLRDKDISNQKIRLECYKLYMKLMWQEFLVPRMKMPLPACHEEILLWWFPEDEGEKFISVRDLDEEIIFE